MICHQDISSESFKRIYRGDCSHWSEVFEVFNVLLSDFSERKAGAARLVSTTGNRRPPTSTVQQPHKSQGQSPSSRRVFSASESLEGLDPACGLVLGGDGDLSFPCLRCLYPSRSCLSPRRGTR